MRADTGRALAIASEQSLEGRRDVQAHFKDEDSKGQQHKVTEKVVELGFA